MFNANLTNVSIFSVTDGMTKTGKKYLQVRASVGTGVKTGRQVDGKDEYGREWVNFSVFDAAVDRWKEKLVKGAKVNVTGKISIDKYTSNRDSSAQATVVVNFPEIELVASAGAAESSAPASASDAVKAQKQAAEMNIPAGLDEELPFA